MHIETLTKKLKQTLFEVYLYSTDYVEELYEKAMGVKDLKDLIRALTNNIFLHLYKIICFGSEYQSTVNHWCSEINANLMQFCNKSVKRSNKPLTTEQILNIMFTVYSTPKDLQSIMGKLYNEYGYSEYDCDTVYSIIEKIMPKLINYVKDTEKPKPEHIQKIIQENI